MGKTDKADMAIILIFILFMMVALTGFLSIYILHKVPKSHVGYGGSKGHMTPNEVESIRKSHAP